MRVVYSPVQNLHIPARWKLLCTVRSAVRRGRWKGNGASKRASGGTERRGGGGSGRWELPETGGRVAEGQESAERIEFWLWQVGSTESSSRSRRGGQEDLHSKNWPYRISCYEGNFSSDSPKLWWESRGLLALVYSLSLFLPCYINNTYLFCETF